MDENSKKVLDMLAEGKITADEAARLLENLGRMKAANAPSGGVSMQEFLEQAIRPPGSDADASTAGADRPTPKNPRYLRVVVQSAKGDNVNVRVPMALVRTGIRLGALMPEHARKELESKGVDLSGLSNLDGDELVRALAELTVDVDSGNGDKVRVFCE